MAAKCEHIFTTLGGLLLVVGLVFFFPQPTLQHATVVIGGQTFSVEVADTPALQARGLSGRSRLADNAGMLFPFSEPKAAVFWMQGMKFSLDIVWLRDGEVVGVVESAPAPTMGEAPAVYSSPGMIDAVLEVNAGTVQWLGIRVGDRLYYNK